MNYVIVHELAHSAGNEPFRAFLDAGGEYTAGLAGTAQAA